MAAAAPLVLDRRPRNRPSRRVLAARDEATIGRGAPDTRRPRPARACPPATRRPRARPRSRAEGGRRVPERSRRSRSRRRSSPRSPGGRHDFFSEGDYWWPDPGEPGRAVRPSRRAVEPGQLRRPPAGADAHEPRRAGAGRGLAAHRRAHATPSRRRATCAPGSSTRRPAWRRTCATPRPCTVAGAAAESESSTPSTWSRWRGRSRSWRRRPACRRPSGKRRAALVRRLPALDDQRPERHRGARGEEQPRHLLGDAGGGLRAADRERASCSAFCRERFKTVLVPNQVAADGSFPLETARTKPYGYSLFNLDAMATTAFILSAPGEDLWRFETADGRGLRRAVAWMVPFVRERKSWPFPQDVMYDEQWPMRHASLLFAGLAYGEPAGSSCGRRCPPTRRWTRSSATSSSGSRCCGWRSRPVEHRRPAAGSRGGLARWRSCSRRRLLASGCRRG